MSGIYNLFCNTWCFRSVSRSHIFVFFNRRCSTMNLVEEEVGRTDPYRPSGLKLLPYYFVSCLDKLEQTMVDKKS